ncbi:hypothetical protein D3C75_1340110 [compost metagenome]
MTVGVVLADQQRKLLAIPRRLEAFVDRFDQLQSLGLMGNVTRPLLLWRQPLTQVMQQAGPAYGERLFV